jgi:hypothetical protein
MSFTSSAGSLLTRSPPSVAIPLSHDEALSQSVATFLEATGCHVANSCTLASGRTALAISAKC